MIEVFQKECKESVIKEGIALKSNYNFDELQKYLEQIY